MFRLSAGILSTSFSPLRREKTHPYIKGREGRVGKNIVQKIIDAHYVSGDKKPGKGGRRPDRPDPHPGRYRDDGVPAVRGDGRSPGKDRRSPSPYVDHNTLQERVRERRRPPVPADGRREARDLLLPRRERHLPPGPRRAVRRPRQDVLGSDSHTPTGGGIGMSGDRRGGAGRRRGDGGRSLLHDVSESGQGEPRRETPAVGGGQGRHPQSLLEILTTKGNVGSIVEYGGDGVGTLSVPERATITNMGAELRRDHLDLPLRQGDEGVPQGPGPRGAW